MSANLDDAASSSFFCRTCGGALVQFKVLRLLIFPFIGLTFPGSVDSLSFPLLLSKMFRLVGGVRRSLEDLECSSFFSRRESALVGVTKLVGNASSSAVFAFCTCADGRESDRLRKETPSKCRIFRLFGEQSFVSFGLRMPYMPTHGR